MTWTRAPAASKRRRERLSAPARSTGKWTVGAAPRAGLGKGARAALAAGLGAFRPLARAASTRPQPYRVSGPARAEVDGGGAQGGGHVLGGPAGVLLQQQGADAGGDGGGVGGTGDLGVLAHRERFRALGGTAAGDGEDSPTRGDDVGLDAAVRRGAAGAAGGDLPAPGMHRADGDDPGGVGGHGDVVPVAEGLVAGGGDDDDPAGHGELGGAAGEGRGPVQILPVVPGAVIEAVVADRGVDHPGAEAVGPLDGGDPTVLLDGQLPRHAASEGVMSSVLASRYSAAGATPINRPGSLPAMTPRTPVPWMFWPWAASSPVTGCPGSSPTSSSALMKSRAATTRRPAKAAWAVQLKPASMRATRTPSPRRPREWRRGTSTAATCAREGP